MADKTLRNGLGLRVPHPPSARGLPRARHRVASIRRLGLGLEETGDEKTKSWLCLVKV